MTIYPFLFMFIAFQSHFQQSNSSKLNNFTDLESLLAFKSHVSDPYNYVFSNWTTDTLFCNWLGVTCSARHKRVVSLELDGFSLQGTIPPQIGNLSFLSVLVLRNNSFSGSIPESLGKLRRLKLIRLSRNHLTGAIPSAFINSSGLHKLALSFNFFSGNIPNELGYLPYLNVLALGQNDLSGLIPKSFGNLTELFQLDMSVNNLAGEIPNLSNLRKVSIIYLWDNKLTGSIKTFDNLTEITELDVGSNNLAGEIPNLSNLHKVSFLNLSKNSLTGSIKTFGNLTEMTVLDVSMNNLVGEISNLSNLRKLSSIYLWNNSLTGSIETFGNLTEMTELDLRFNNLVGEIPNLSNLHKLRHLNLAANQFTGSIPISLLNVSSLIGLELVNNNLSGSVPATLGMNLPSLEILGLGQNKLSGGLDFLASLSSCVNLTFLGLHTNDLDGTIPNSVGNLSTQLQFFNLAENRIKGNIPAAFGNLNGLLQLYLYNNELTGEIPVELTQIKTLQLLYLFNNRLSGSIPSELGLMKSLFNLNLGQNKLSGSIPDTITNLTGLQYLVLSSNKLTSSIPTSLVNLQGLIGLNLSHNNLQGTIPSQLGNLNALSTLDLSSNRLSGNIPFSFGKMQQISSLDISSNSLEGVIPESLSQLISIVCLNLSHNLLSGSIPETLKELRYLRSLDLSFNKLVGKIPTDGVFSNSSILIPEGNMALCGALNRNIAHCSPHKQHLLKYILPPVAAAAILFACFFLMLKVCLKRKLKTPSEGFTVHSHNFKSITYYEIARATGNFSETNLLGKGNFSTVYKATLDDGLIAAVKVLNLNLEGSSDSFDAECRALSMLRHRNLVKIISTCTNTEFKALILQFMSNGTLDQWLHSEDNSVNLLQRINIMINVSLAIEHLHHHHHNIVLHCDLKPSNILLDENMVAYVSDFGIAKILANNGITNSYADAPGTIGYIAPEYASSGNVTRRSDVYSFGILMLETVTGKRPTDPMFHGALSIRQWTKNAYPDAILDVADSKILREDSADARRTEVQEKCHQCLASIIELGLLCSSNLPAERMLMTEVVLKLQKIKMDYLLTLPNQIDNV